MVVRKAVRRSVPKELLDFTPVPRRQPRHDGWTPERQRAFIEALADTGCVAIAARMVNMSQASVYRLRRQPGAESFRAAMDAAQTLGLQPVKDEAFDRAMNGQLVPVFVGGKLMGFRRKKNDRLLMFILRHYGQDALGRKTTVNYFSTRASAGGAADPSAIALAKAEASTTTLRTVISGPAAAPTQLAADDRAAAVVNAFQGVALDEEAQAEIYRALEACAERRRALEHDPDNDPDCGFVRVAPGDLRYLGELESGVEGDWVEYRPDGEHDWQNLGEGGAAAEIDKVLAGMAERKAAMTPDRIAAEQSEHEAEVRRMREARALPPPTEPDPDDPRLDWRNWTDKGYTPPSSTPAHPEPVEGPPSLSVHPEPACPGPRSGVEGPISPRTGKPLKRYRKRQPKPVLSEDEGPPFPAPGQAAYEARKAEAITAVEAERRELAAAEAERRRKRRA